MSLKNFVVLDGNVGSDPTVDQDGTWFRLATNEWYLDSEGNRKEYTEWHTVCVKGRLGEFVARYCGQGRAVSLRGVLRTRKERGTFILVVFPDGELDAKGPARKTGLVAQPENAAVTLDIPSDDSEPMPGAPRLPETDSREANGKRKAGNVREW